MDFSGGNIYQSSTRGRNNVSADKYSGEEVVRFNQNEFITTTGDMTVKTSTTATIVSTIDEGSENDRPPVDFQVSSGSEDSDSENFDQLMMTTSPSLHSGVFVADQVR